MDSIKLWRNHKRSYALCGQICTSCNKKFYPKKHLCSCGSRDFQDFNFSGHGKILSFTKVNNPPKKFKTFSPYLIGLIELREGVKIIAQITDTQLSDLKIGMPVKTVFRKLCDGGQKGVIAYGVKFKAT
jgi:uncharacterized OB-fold protein